MKTTAKTIKQDLARCKSYYLRNEDLRALHALGMALKGFVSVKLAGMDKSEIETQFREAFSNVGKIALVAKLAPKGLPYLKGQEAKLLRYVGALYQKVKEETERVTLEALRERKLKIDQCVLKGQKFLDEGNLLEAQRNFREAVSLYVDEHGLFTLLALKLQEKGHYKASLEYLKGSIEVTPDNARTYDLLLTALAKTGEDAPGIKVLCDARKKVGDHPLLTATLQKLQARNPECEC
ncbi:hypothetical protein JCM15519_12470 [Fundidesulfovibrio butyratiphilus]